MTHSKELYTGHKKQSDGGETMMKMIIDSSHRTDLENSEDHETHDREVMMMNV